MGLRYVNDLPVPKLIVPGVKIFAVVVAASTLRISGCGEENKGTTVPPKSTARDPVGAIPAAAMFAVSLPDPVWIVVATFAGVLSTSNLFAAEPPMTVSSVRFA